MSNGRRWCLRAARVFAVLGCVGLGGTVRAADEKAAKPESPLAREKAKGKAYLDQAAKEEGAQKTKSGLVYVPLRKGKGLTPRANETVRVHYTGTFTDGKVFDSSVARKQPAEFPLDAVIPCWTEGVQKIQVGGKAKLVCPSDLAYGDGGAGGGMIPGGATLVFEVELLEILRK
jgi:FKBP-type peptidyl-prolyl cis-trans isomerase FkpA